MKNLDKYLVSGSLSLRELMQTIGQNTRGIALVVDDIGRLETTLTDGDVRRGFLDGLKIDNSVGELVQSKNKNHAHSPVTIDLLSSDEERLTLMESQSIRQLPIVNELGSVIDIVFKEELLGGATLRLNYTSDDDLDIPLPTVEAHGVIMAGGFGTRLRPLTDNLPKPMLPVNGRPLLELIIERFERSGIRKIFLSTHYKKEVIENHFKQGQGFNVEISYIHEDEPIGTAGALGLMEGAKCPLVMTNGDILTKVGLNSLLEFHNDHGAKLTVGVRQYDIKVPFGVMNTDGVNVSSIEEKPVLDFLVNAGVYVVSPEAQRMIPKGCRYDMTDLIEAVIAKGGVVVAFPIVEYWLDIGQMVDYEEAQRYGERGPSEF